MKELASAFVSGLLFAAGLVLAGMTQPAKVVGFLDFFGAWDPSLAMVMVGAIGTYLPIFAIVKRRRTPLFSALFVLPTRRDIDRRLLLGAALFGIGWGLGGFCPGPAIVSVPTWTAPALVFTTSMVLGMILFRVVTRPRAEPGPASF